MPFVMSMVLRWIMIPESSGDKSYLAGRSPSGINGE